jgi:hypothetical protein
MGAQERIDGLDVDERVARPVRSSSACHPRPVLPHRAASALLEGLGPLGVAQGSEDRGEVHTGILDRQPGQDVLDVLHAIGVEAPLEQLVLVDGLERAPLRAHEVLRVSPK